MTGVIIIVAVFIGFNGHIELRRVLAVTAVAPTVAQAAARSQAAAERIEFDGRHFRRDIGWREAARTAKGHA